LVSYYYLKYKNAKELEEIFAFVKVNKMNIFLDSGAFSFMAKKSDIDYTKFTLEYIEFIRKWYDYIYCYAEMDIDLVVGYREVLKLRKLFTPDIRPKLLPVFHPETRIFKDWENDCDEFDFLALGSKGSTTSAKSLQYYKRMVGYAYKHSKRVHGFALINQEILKSFPFFSADSASWLSVNMYGRMFVFDSKDNKLKSESYRDKEFVLKHFKKLMQQHPALMDMYLDSINSATNNNRLSCTTRLILSGGAYMDLEEYLTKLWEKRGIQKYNF